MRGEAKKKRIKGRSEKGEERDRVMAEMENGGEERRELKKETAKNGAIAETKKKKNGIF